MSILSIVEMIYWLINFLIRLLHFRASNMDQLKLETPKVNTVKTEKKKKEKLRKRCNKIIKIKEKLRMMEKLNKEKHLDH